MCWVSMLEGQFCVGGATGASGVGGACVGRSR